VCIYARSIFPSTNWGHHLFVYIDGGNKDSAPKASILDILISLILEHSISNLLSIIAVRLLSPCLVPLDHNCLPHCLIYPWFLDNNSSSTIGNCIQTRIT
jgi:hypothetical protein